MTVELLLFAVPGLPALMAALLVFAPCRRWIPILAPLAALPALAAAFGPPAALYDEPWLVLGAQIGLDTTGRAFLGAVAFLWALAAAAAAPAMRADPERTRFFVCFLFAMAGNLGLFVAADVFSFYALFATMSFAAYGLVAHRGDAAASAAGRLYVGFVILGELALFSGFALGAASLGSTALADFRTGPLPDAAVALLIVGFAVKLGLVPAHVWLPAAHAEAPIAASAVLSGAMVKAGLFGSMATLPLGAVAIPHAGAALVACGLASIALAPILGAVRSSPKAVLAFSTIAQMGLGAVAVGIGLGHPHAWEAIAPAVVLFAANHTLAKGALFLGVGVCDAARSRLARRVVLIVLLAPAATLAALPSTLGYLAKSRLDDTFALASGPWAAFLPVALAVSSAGTALLMARFFLLMHRRPGPAMRASRLVTPPWAALVVVLLVASFVAMGGPGAEGLSAEAAAMEAAPAAAGLALAVGAAIALRAAGLSLASDVLQPRPPFLPRRAHPATVVARPEGGARFHLRTVLRPLRRPESEAFGWKAVLCVVCLLVAVLQIAPRPGD